MASQFVRAMPEAAAVVAVGRNSTSGSAELPAPKRDAAIKKPPRRNRPRSCARRDVSTRELRMHVATRNETFLDDDKENVCDGSRSTGTPSDGLKAQKPVVSASPSPARSTGGELMYRQCLGSVIASYLSPLQGPKDARSGRHAHRRFFDTLTSPGDETPVPKPSRDDHRNDHDDDDDDDNVNNNNTNTSVWLSDSVESSSGVETATSSPPDVIPDSAREQVRAQFS